jgi:hypothetical protein
LVEIIDKNDDDENWADPGAPPVRDREMNKGWEGEREGEGEGKW